MTKYEDLVNNGQVQFGTNFDSSDLAPQFVNAYNSGDRVEVHFVSKDGEVYETKRGTIGATTGWKPVFLLMLTKRSTGSMYTLNSRDKLGKVIRHQR